MRWGSCPGSSLAAGGPGAQCCSLPFRSWFSSNQPNGITLIVIKNTNSISGGRLKSRKADDMNLRGLLVCSSPGVKSTCKFYS